MLTPVNYGCGRSYHWEYTAIHIAEKLNEKCDHLHIKNIFVQAVPTPNSPHQAKFLVNCTICNKILEKTSIKLTEKICKFRTR